MEWVGLYVYLYHILLTMLIVSSCVHMCMGAYVLGVASQ